MRKAVLPLVLGILASSGANADFPEDMYFPLGVTAETVSQLWEQVRRQADDRLFDPSSVQYRCITVLELQPEDGFMVLGEFNAKNLYGGYVGFKGFTSFIGADLEHKLTLFTDKADNKACESYRKLRKAHGNR